MNSLPTVQLSDAVSSGSRQATRLSIREVPENPETIRPSELHARYFEGGDGRTFIPIGLNLCFPRFAKTFQQGLTCYEEWIRKLARNRCNFMRLWLGHPFFNPESAQAGVFDSAPGERLMAVLEMARRNGIKVKLTLEHFRDVRSRAQAELFPGAASFSNPLYALENRGYAKDMADFLGNPDCRRRYLAKLDWFSAHFAGHPVIFGWELWNEMNAVGAAGWLDWTRFMLPELKRRFPGHLIMQSLGSFDSEAARIDYADYARLFESDLVQGHRYVDPGAELGVCHGPMDTLCADAISELRRMAPGKPVVLAECGAVEARHAGPSLLYEEDKTGVLLHDCLFAPFFAGAAGPGQAWHWDFYVQQHDLWWHFARFAEAIAEFDPVAEQAEPVQWHTARLSIYALRGRRTSLLWIRERQARDDVRLLSAPIVGERLVLPAPFMDAREVSVYEPWTNHRHPDKAVCGEIQLPVFHRSLVLRMR